MRDRGCSLSILTASCCLLILRGQADAQQTLGLLSHTSGSYDSGYVLLSPSNDTAYLIDKCGYRVHTWHGSPGGNGTAYLLDDGSIMRGSRVNPLDASVGARTEHIDWDGNVLWSHAIASATERQHHGIWLMPNGNVLVIAQDVRSRDDAIAAGRDTSKLGATLFGEEILELHPVSPDSTDIVWRWRVWDHLVQSYDPLRPNYGSVADHPELADLNYTSGDPKQADWLHVNGVAYNAALDQIAISNHNFSEYWIVDHGTTTVEAASHNGGRRGRGGDMLYRWGNPAAYRHGSTADQKLFGNHDVEWIPDGLPHAGSILLLDNGTGRPQGDYSTVEIVAAQQDSAGNYSPATLPFGPAASSWTYAATPPTEFYSKNLGGAQMLPNGNIMVCNGSSGTFFEIDSNSRTVWKYQLPIAGSGPLVQGTVVTALPIFRCAFIPGSHPGLAGRTLIPGAPLELDPLPYDCTLNTRTAIHDATLPSRDAIVCFPNPSTRSVFVAGLSDIERVTLFNVLGGRVDVAVHGGEIDTRDLPAGVYRLIAAGRGVTAASVISIVR